METNRPADAVVAKLLAQVPALRQWTNRPLDDHLQGILKHADKQTLMSITVHALSRLVREQSN